MAKLILRTLEFTFYHLLIYFVDRLSRLPRASVPPDAMRLYRENLALKVQLDAVAAETTRLRGKRARVSLRTRAAQVWAYLITRGNRPFQKHNLSASPRTIKRWATKLRQGPWKSSAPRKRQGRPPTRAEIVEMVLTLKRENPGWGQKKLAQALRRLGIPVSAPTVQRILEDNGFGPPGGGRTWEEYTSAAKDAWWALDFFVVRTLHGQLLQVMAIIDVHTRELLGLRAHDGWDVDSVWTMRTLAAALSESKRKPTAVNRHDPGSGARALRSRASGWTPCSIKRTQKGWLRRRFRLARCGDRRVLRPGEHRAPRPAHFKPRSGLASIFRNSSRRRPTRRSTGLSAAHAQSRSQDQ